MQQQGFLQFNQEAPIPFNLMRLHLSIVREIKKTLTVEDILFALDFFRMIHVPLPNEVIGQQKQSEEKNLHETVKSDNSTSNNQINHES